MAATKQPMAPITLGRGLPEEGRAAGERELLAFVEAALVRAGWHLPYLLVVDYYIALKTQRFVILLGHEGKGKRHLAQTFAETLVGSNSDQLASIQVRPPQPGVGSKPGLFNDIYERFSWIKFVEFLERAAAPENSGKAYFLCLEDLSSFDIETYFELFLRRDGSGQYRLALPGYPPERWPVVPSGLFICGTVNADERCYRLSDAVLGRVGSIEFSVDSLPGRRVETNLLGVPPVGLQRLMLAPVPQSGQQALLRLRALLGQQPSVDLQPSPALSRLIEASGVCFDVQAQDYIWRYVANSFDSEGYGFFERHDRLRNYRLALDFQVTRQALVRLRCRAPLEIQAAIEAHLETLFG
ncbi:MAG: hypothetical protein KatS3mg057_0419 [Herpetosiphonaceae bacterium]|nr:MAG: hypothetical protein KatS3mg057_0419 [Herpetosiphonaceae bacterium]